MASRGAPSSEQAHCAYGGREYSPAGASKLAAPIFLISPARSEDPGKRPRMAFCGSLIERGPPLGGF